MGGPADIDIFRVGNAFYYSASTMHYSPGAPVLRSFDLVNWEFAGHSVPRNGAYYVFLTRPANGQYILKSTNGPFGPYQIRQLLLDLRGPPMCRSATLRPG